MSASIVTGQSRHQSPIFYLIGSASCSLGQRHASDLVFSEIRLVLIEAETAKPPADVHGRAPHGYAGHRDAVIARLKADATDYIDALEIK